MNKTVLLVGCGNMGYALLKGWIDKAIIAKTSVYVVEPTDANLKRAVDLGVHGIKDHSEIPEHFNPDLVILAVKPQHMAEVAPAYSKYSSKTTFLTIAAGLSVKFFEDIFGSDAAIVRCMPNTPAAIGQGVLVTYANKNVSTESYAFIEKLLTANGVVSSIHDEAQMHAVTGLSGSGPAYVFYLIEALTKAGISCGLSEKTATLLAKQTVKGAGMLACENDDVTPEVLRQRVTSPNGTTAAGLAVLMKDGTFERQITETVKAATERSKELANN